MTIHRTLTVNWIDLVQHEDCAEYFGGLRVQDAFAVFRWLAVNGPLGVRSRLSIPGWWGGYGGLTIPAVAQRHGRFSRHSWPVELRARFARLLLARHLEHDDPMIVWMREQGIAIGLQSKLPIRNDSNENPFGAVKVIESLYGLAGRRYKRSPNSVHAEAVNVIGGAIVPVMPSWYNNPDIHWSADLVYGFDGSEWRDSKTANPRELLIPFLRRAVAEWTEQMDPE